MGKAKPGRKKRPNVRRYPSGAIVRADRGESPEQIKAVAMNNPERRGKPSPDSPFHGYALGTLLFGGMLTPEQVNAAERFIRASAAYRRVMDCPNPSPKSPGFEMVSHGLPSLKDIVDDSDEEEIERQAQIRRDYNNAMRLVLDLEEVHKGVWLALLRSCCDDKLPDDAHMMGNLRLALNVLARKWK